MALEDLTSNGLRVIWKIDQYESQMYLKHNWTIGILNIP